MASDMEMDEAAQPGAEDRPVKRPKREADLTAEPPTTTSISAGADPHPPVVNDTAKEGAEVKKFDLAENGASTTKNLSRSSGRSTTAGVAPIKPEYLIPRPDRRDDVPDDDALEGRGSADKPDGDRGPGAGRKKRDKGQNKERHFGSMEDDVRLCPTRANSPEFSPRECTFGDNCKFSHDLRTYLASGRQPDLDTFNGSCPVFDAHGRCPSGWKCRFVRSHMREIQHSDGRSELVLVDPTMLTAPVDIPSITVEVPKEHASDAPATATESSEPTMHNEDASGPSGTLHPDADESRPDIVNIVPSKLKNDLSRKRVDCTRADQYIAWLNKDAKASDQMHQRIQRRALDDVEELRAQFTDPPFLPSEKRRLHFGPETPALAPLTTQGNIPFRRLCIELGAELTYSEMAMSMPLLQGTKTDWTLLRAHRSEMDPPRYTTATAGYDHSRDLRFGAQISATAPWQAIKVSDVLARFCPRLRLLDLNCGCPIDMVYRAGAGSALLDSPNKLERIVRGMNALSGEIPVTTKLRTGIRTGRPNAISLLGKLAFGSREHRDRLGAPGCAAITLHGRSREQRYTRSADWDYIAECATLVKSYNTQTDNLTDTVREPDPRTLPAGGRLFFLGNGDVFSHEDYNTHLRDTRVDAIMIGRGALVKPWIFEEIAAGQYLDYSASQRLDLVNNFARYGLDAWGSDELGINFTRRFLLEWLSFHHRYVPVALLERLPPCLNDRPPPFRGRNDMETLLASANYKDWIKISDMFLGPARPSFQFQPKHKSNAYEAEG